MVSIYICLSVMLLVAVSFLALAYYNQARLTVGKFFVSSFFLIFATIGLYQFSGNKLALQNWLLRGKEHYALMEQFQELGGLDGMIVRVKQRLAENPHDKKGWMILGKLYEAKQDMPDAKNAYAKATTE